MGTGAAWLPSAGCPRAAVRSPPPPLRVRSRRAPRAAPTPATKSARCSRRRPPPCRALFYTHYLSRHREHLRRGVRDDHVGQNHLPVRASVWPLGRWLAVPHGGVRRAPSPSSRGFPLSPRPRDRLLRAAARGPEAHAAGAAPFGGAGAPAGDEDDVVLNGRGHGFRSSKRKDEQCRGTLDVATRIVLYYYNGHFNDRIGFSYCSIGSERGCGRALRRSASQASRTVTTGSSIHAFAFAVSISVSASSAVAETSFSKA